MVFWFEKFKKSLPPKILLINPPYQRLRNMLSEQMPMGLLYLAGTLNKNGFETKVLNLEEPEIGESLQSGYVNSFENYYTYLENKNNHDHPAWKELKNYLTAYQPDIVGFSVMTPYYSLALDMASFVRKQIKALIVFGGPHPTICPEQVAQNECVDVVVVGEGEKVLLELAKNFTPHNRNFLYKIPSLFFFDQERINHTQLIPLQSNLDVLPPPDYNALVKPEPSSLADRFGVITGRGCPYRCNFCIDNLLWRGKSRFRSAESIVMEIKTLVSEFGLRTLFFQQDSFLNKKNLAISVAKKIIDEKLGLQWWCAARVDQIDHESIQIFKESGLTNIILGIESGNQKVLEMMNKKITIAQIEKAVKILKTNGIYASAFFMIGLPDETESQIRETMLFMQKLQLDFVSLSVFTPFPGSPLFTRCEELNLIDKNVDWSMFDYQSPENYFCGQIARERFKELVQEASALADQLNRKKT
ncbi:MAG: radical SAM protein [Desulfamplus sp.]|nr:radical SAM protein [Desulfamplus sp.]